MVDTVAKDELACTSSRNVGLYSIHELNIQKKSRRYSVNDDSHTTFNQVILATVSRTRAAEKKSFRDSMGPASRNGNGY